MTFEDYVNIGSNVQTDEQLTGTKIQTELQSGPMRDLEEELAEEANTIEPNICSLADNSYWSIFLDESSHLYNRVFPSVGWSFGRSIRQSAGHAFIKNRKIDDH